MRILTLNCGSSTLKFRLFQSTGERGAADLRPEADGIVDRIGGRSFTDFTLGGERLRQEHDVADHAEATRLILDWLASIYGPEAIDAVGYRIVHGGASFVEPTLVDDDVLAGIESLSELAPLHNAPALAAIREARVVLGESVPMVAVFDTAFHRSMPERAARYAIPTDLADRHRVYRYGFHGLAHRYMTERYAVITGAALERTKLVTLQLGNGCSAAAVDGGRSIDTSMGFTPLEGLVMGTRSGDIDPSVVSYLAGREGVEPREVERWLNAQSGLLGVSGRSADMRDLLEAKARGDDRAARAVELFCYRARKYIGAYLAALGGADAVVFGGGIGENAPAVRARICAGMEWCGLRLHADQNDATVASEGRISAEDSEVAVYVLPVDEELIIARDTARCVGK
ncbi:MAG: acetate kinase [Dehalococcoidia bacterium]